jgi:glycosyltransferase involved in cell wall biosynthesis
MKKLSVIVPVYNVERYLAKCLDSLLNQNMPLDEYEIIIINDGSTDSSLDIAKQYARTFSQIRVITQDNKGLSAARNTAIQLVEGKYIQFVDSDDYLEPNVLVSLLKKMEHDELDVLRFNYQDVNESYEVIQPYKHPTQFVDYSDSVTDGLSFLNERLGYACYVWQFIFSKTIISPFKDGIYFEDTEWTPRTLTQAKRITSVNTIVYNYLAREGSITKSSSDEKKRKILQDKMSLIDSLLFQQQNQTDKRWYMGMITMTVISILGIIALERYSERYKHISNLKSKDIFPLSEYHCSKHNKFKVRMINFSVSFYCWFIKVNNNL